MCESLIIFFIHSADNKLFIIKYLTNTNSALQKIMPVFVKLLLVYENPIFLHSC